LIKDREDLMGNCDLCNTPIGANAKRYSALQMREAVRAGLRPDSTGPLAALAMVSGGSIEEMNAGWVQQVMTDTTDWAMCPTCTAKVESYLSKSGGWSLTVHAPTSAPALIQPRQLTSKKWWQFWR
jgi:hypothetical protein